MYKFYVVKYSHMFKKIIFTFIILTFASITVFANNTMIPHDKKNQYRIEIQNRINYLTPITIKNINEIETEIKNEKNQHIKNMLISDGINSELLKFYIELLEITNKYTNTPIIIPPTDWYKEIKNVIDPYLKDNHICTIKINYLLIYAKYKQSQIKNTVTTN